jgi:hypothetical protein
MRSSTKGLVFPNEGIFNKADKKKKDFLLWKTGWIIVIELDFNFINRGVDLAQLAIVNAKGEIGGLWFRSIYWEN